MDSPETPGRSRRRLLDGRRRPSCSGYLMGALSIPRLSVEGSLW